MEKEYHNKVDNNSTDEIGIIGSRSENFKILVKRVRVEMYCFIVPVRFNYFQLIGKGAYGIVIAAYLDEEAKENFRKKNISHDKNGVRTCMAIKKFIDPFRSLFIASRALRELIIKFINGYTTNENSWNLSEIYICNELLQTDLACISTEKLTHKHISFFIYQIICGLLHLHEHKIIHRDLKPGNIVVNTKCELKILDFGLSCQTNNSMTPYVVTRYYRAPEVLIGLNYTEKVDNWSVGCILAEMILNKIVFRGDNTVNQLTAILKVVGKPSMSFYEKLPEEFKRQCFDHIWTKEYKNNLNQVFNDDILKKSNATTARDINDCKELLFALLTFDQEHRVSDTEALAMNYISKWLDDVETKRVI
ncbi:MAG: Mitogen-activated protein kinase 10 [Paramarteilia canceri]